MKKIGQHNALVFYKIAFFSGQENENIKKGRRDEKKGDTYLEEVAIDGLVA